MAADIVFVNPPLTLAERYGVLASGGSSLPPYGLLWLAAVCREEGYTPTILDAAAKGLDPRAAAEAIAAQNPRFVGITSTTISITRAHQTALHLKQLLPEATILIGGPHATAVPEDTLERYQVFDVLVVGEAEDTIVPLLRTIDEDGDLAGVDGILYRKPDGALHRTMPRAFIEDLDKLPLPAWDLIDSPEAQYAPSAMRSHRFPSTSLVTSRGCMGACTFCDNQVFGRKVRSFSPGYILRMMEYLIENWGIRDITIYDDNFVTRRDVLKKVCESLEEKQWDLSWSCNARVDVVTEKSLTWMAKAGCWQISFGIESGNQEILDREIKGVTLDRIRKTIQFCHDLGIHTKGFFMIGHPGETRETIQESVEFAKSMPLDSFQMSFVTPFPGTAMYHEAHEYGEFIEDWEKMNMWTPVFVPHGFDVHELIALQKKALRSFYLQPRIIWSYLRSIHSWGRVKGLAAGLWTFLSAQFARRDILPFEGEEEHVLSEEEVLGQRASEEPAPVETSSRPLVTRWVPPDTSESSAAA
jgi:radical SAM superfamily enzyme YgiQ (UPF0313 family)